jgi:hypothetical protein
MRTVNNIVLDDNIKKLLSDEGIVYDQVFRSRYSKIMSKQATVPESIQGVIVYGDDTSPVEVVLGLYGIHLIFKDLKIATLISNQVLDQERPEIIMPYDTFLVLLLCHMVNQHGVKLVLNMM